MSELKPCPFCGGEAETVRTFGIGSEAREYYMTECLKCWAKTGFYSEKKDAVNLWNQRAERTCKQVLTECNDGLMPPFTAHCSECGAQWGYTPNYCQNCGAKVV